MIHNKQYPSMFPRKVAICLHICAFNTIFKIMQAQNVIVVYVDF